MEVCDIYMNKNTLWLINDLNMVKKEKKIKTKQKLE